MAKGSKTNVNDTQITVITENKVDFISLTDMTSGFNEGSGLIGKWITNKNTLEYVGTWEKINNPIFNYTEFGVIENEAGVNRYSNEIIIKSSGDNQKLEMISELGVIAATLFVA
jgi:hypothetical protein